MEAAEEEHMGSLDQINRRQFQMLSFFFFFSKLHYLMTLSGPARFEAVMQVQTKLVALAILLIRPQCRMHVVCRLAAASCFETQDSLQKSALLEIERKIMIFLLLSDFSCLK